MTDKHFLFPQHRYLTSGCHVPFKTLLHTTTAEHVIMQEVTKQVSVNVHDVNLYEVRRAKLN